MNDDLNEFERLARARLHRELGRVPVPAGRTVRARPRSSQSWGRRLAGGSAALAMLVLVAMIAASVLRVAPETAQPPRSAQVPQSAGGSPAERLILLSAAGSRTIVRAVDPATRQLLWQLEQLDQAAAASQGGGTPTPAWIDGALSPDGSRLFVATSAGLAAYDAATGRSLWATESADVERIVRNLPGRTSALAVAADGQRVYIQKETAPGQYYQRRLDVVDAATGKAQGTIALPGDEGVAQVFALANQLFYVTEDDVYVAPLDSRSISAGSRLDVLRGVSVAAPARDGRMIYVSNGVTLLRFNGSGMVSPPDAKSEPVHGIPRYPVLSLSEAISGTNMIIDFDSMKAEIDPEDPFWWRNAPLALSPDGSLAAILQFTAPGQAEPPRVLLYDVASWTPVAVFPDRSAGKSDRLRGDTLQFSQDGASIYAIAGPSTYGGGDSALVALDLAGGGVSRLIELPGETVSGLLAAAPPAPDLPPEPTSIVVGGPGLPEIDLPPDAVMPPPVELPPAVRERGSRIPLTGLPLVPSGEIAWVFQNDDLTARDRDGSTTRPITDSTVAAFRWAVPRPGKRPLLLVGLADGRDGILDPESGRITPLDVPARSITPPLFLSPDGAQLVFQHAEPGRPAALAQADLTTGATWTLIEDESLSDGVLAGWNADGIYVDVDSISKRRLLRIQPRASADAAQPQFETLLELDGGWLSFSPAGRLVAYRRVGDSVLHLLDTRSGEEQTVDAIGSGRFALSPDGSRLAYVRPDGDDTSSLLIYTPHDQSSAIVVAGLPLEQTSQFEPRWSADSRYLITLAGTGPTEIQVFDTRSMVYESDQPYDAWASYALPGPVGDVAVQRVTVGGGDVINVVTISGGADGTELNVYNPVTSTRQTFDLGDAPADLAFVP